jgi:hypothetical protein
MFGGSGGGRTRHQTQVHLNLYDLSPANDCLYPLGLGLHHSGVEVLGSEYSYAGEGGGIFESSPGEAPGARFRERVYLGSYDGGSAELTAALDQLRRSGNFASDGYHLVTKNCNHFANALVWALLRKPIPPHVNRVADVAGCFVGLLPRRLLADSPVGPNRGGSSGRGGGSAPAAAFMGRGARLGGDDGGVSAGRGGLFGMGSGNSYDSSGGSSTEGKRDELTDRREKARQAALARMERNNAGTTGQ